METFNNREIATLIWLLFFAMLASTKKGIRDGLGDVIKAFFRWKIYVPAMILAAYVAACVYGLSILNIWAFTQLKNTIIWTAFVGVASMFRVGTSKDDPRLLRKWVEDNLKLTVVFEFVITIPVFSIFGELILVPSIALLVMLQVVAETREEYKQVAKLINWLLALVGFTVLVYACFTIFEDLGKYATMQTAMDFYTPLLLSLLIIPYLFVFYVIVTYETALTWLEIMDIDPSLRSYAKWRAILVFRHRVGLLKRWSRDARSFLLPDRAAIRESMRKVCELWQREQNPPTVDSSEGWSPYAAIKFLDNEGLATDDYHGSEDNWYASSEYLKIGEDIFSDKIAYYVEGAEHVATTLKLVLNVDRLGVQTDSESRFWDLTLKLLQQAISNEDSRGRATTLIGRDEGVTTVGDKRISVARDDWSAGIRKGYSRRFVIEHLSGEESL
ncbi:MAG: hypothetical protein ACFE0S_12890 [Rhodospirillales bacterium]